MFGFTIHCTISAHSRSLFQFLHLSLSIISLGIISLTDWSLSRSGLLKTQPAVLLLAWRTEEETEKKEKRKGRGAVSSVRAWREGNREEKEKKEGEGASGVREWRREKRKEKKEERGKRHVCVWVIQPLVFILWCLDWSTRGSG
jgi:hypothetical protein